MAAVYFPSMKRCTKSHVRTLRLRIKDKHAKVLRAMAYAVNLVWNFVNELSVRVLERERRFIGSAEIQSYLNGASREGLGVGSAVFQQVADEFVTRRLQHRKRRLAWRKSSGARRSLGWIPFKARSLKYHAGCIRFQGHCLSLWDSYGLSGYELGAGTISEDARGSWYINISATPKKAPQVQRQLFADAVGIDLGLNNFAATHEGAMIEAQRYYRQMEQQLAVAQRARKKKRVKAIHARIAARRKDFHHKLSTALVKSYGAIFIGNVNAQALAKTGHSKLVLDAGWSAFRTMLLCKGDDAGTWVEEINEAYSTRTCSACESRTGPVGREGLRIREWTCNRCGAKHHRDVNAATNILAAGRRRLAAGIPILPTQVAALG